MASKNDTVADIAKEIGDAYETWKRSEIAELPTQYLMEWRDRLDVADRRSEEAHQREVSEYYKYPIVDDCGNFENNNDERLIAAAPDLYEALYDVVAYCESTHLVPSERFGEVLTRVKAALAKASGESEVER